MKKGIIGGLIGVVIIAVGAYFAFTMFADDKVKEKADAIVASLNKQPGMNVTYGSVKSDVLKQGIVMDDVVIDRGAKGKVKIGQIQVQDYDWINEKPRHATIILRGLEVALKDLPAQSAEMISKMGYSNILLNAEMDYRYDPEKKTLVVRKFIIDGNDIGTLDIKFTYGNVPEIDPPSNADAAKKNPAAMFALMQMTVVNAAVSFKDKSLVGRLLKAYGARKNLSEADAKQQVLSQIDTQLQQTKDAIMQQALTAARKFVENPGTFSVTMEPPKPVPLLMFMSMQKRPGKAQQMLGLKFAAN